MRTLLVLCMCVAASLALTATEDDLVNLLKKMVAKEAAKKQASNVCMKTSINAIFGPPNPHRPCPKFPTADELKFYQTKITSESEYQHIQNHATTIEKVKQMLEDVKKQFKQAAEAGATEAKDAIDLLPGIYDNLIEPIEVMIYKSTAEQDKWLMKAVIAGVQISGLTDEKNEPGCFDSFPGDQKKALPLMGCVLTKTTLAETVVMETIIPFYQKMLTNGGGLCDAMYEIPDLQSPDFAAVEEKVTSFIDCSVKNLKAIQDTFLPDDKVLKQNGVVVAELITIMNMLWYTDVQIETLRDAGNYVIDKMTSQSARSPNRRGMDANGSGRRLTMNDHRENVKKQESDGCMKTSIEAIFGPPDPNIPCPKFPTAEEFEFYQTKITSESGYENVQSHKATIENVKQMFEDVKTLFKKAREAGSTEAKDAITLMSVIYGNLIEPVEVMMYKSIEKQSKWILKAVIAGVQMDGLTDEQNEPGCLDAFPSEKALTDVQTKALPLMSCALTKAHLVETAASRMGEATYIKLVESDDWATCADMYEIPYLPSADFAAVQKKVTSSIECTENNLQVLQDILMPDGTVPDHNGVVVANLIASRNMLWDINSEVQLLKSAVQFVIDATAKKSAGSPNRRGMDASGPGRKLTEQDLKENVKRTMTKLEAQLRALFN